MLSSKLTLSSSHSVSVPGDKSISHRSVLFSSLAQGKSEIHGFLEGEDPLNTMKCFGKLGVSFTNLGKGSYSVNSPGKKGLTSPKGELDFGNAGTGIRLSAGLLCGLPQIQVVVNGDASLQKRPMARIIDPLTAMGGEIRSLSGDGRAPLEIKGKQLQDYKFKSPIASAQVKSALMLAALSSEIALDYEEDELSRDHTENMIRFLGGSITQITPLRFQMKPPYRFEGGSFKVPGDISSASFYIVLGLCAKGEPTIIRNVGLNPSRVGIITVLRNMGGRIEIADPRKECGEDIGDLVVYPSALRKTEIPASLIPSIIDEIPILAIAGLFSEGGFSIRNAKELRAKESDRITSVITNLQKLGVVVREFEDGYEFDEIGFLTSAKIETYMDHRIAMSFAILAKLSGLSLSFDDTSWVDTSFPGFFEILKTF
ncbi:3-phosphoshikimate 1-carboxyvinyltransferase [Leptospira kobayashii]|uniref:3-phosphoshikimate 1-carboxyvinyltransferase n=1 Tax=Leptospira kobayashii TaxID=1917830 RepID=A0ABN6KDI4_9LEPT|nr:3-phosphoshikimate 1-carboxyvinyltransferase [Leptospira kobayashii]BDA77880.1 3-phosphoshikimate 1-carboxyvinyltransferase [Leptospira kobayashii]